MFHSTKVEIDKLTDSDDICLAPRRDQSTPYLEGEPGYCYEISNTDLHLATEDDIREVASQFDWYDPSYWLYELVDESSCRDALAEAGFDGARYPDMGPRNAYEHDTVRVWATGQLDVVDVEEIN